MRVLITGSRNWEDEAAIVGALNAIERESDSNEVHTLVSGACPTGADAMLEYRATMMGWTIERHPADWTLHGKRAGFVRNAEMVKLGADICLAFIKNDSKGATMTKDLAIKAGIPTRIWCAE